jgi:hypothetical protein
MTQYQALFLSPLCYVKISLTLLTYTKYSLIVIIHMPLSHPSHY